MRTNLLILTGAAFVFVAPLDALAYSHANRYGGSTEHSYGQTEHTNAYGGSTSHAYGEGTEHTNMYGGSTAHAWGGGTEHTNVYGGTTYGKAGEGVAHTAPDGATAYRPPAPVGGAYYPYQPPVAVPYYAAAGCYGCAAAAGAVVGAAAGAAVASANTAAATSSAYSSGYAAGAANTAVATSTAYNAGVAAGASGAAAPPPATAYAMGVSYATLPSGCISPNVQGGTYFLCGNTWFQPSFGANGVFYRVVPAP